MKTTEVIVEFLAIGVLVVVSLAYLAASLFPALVPAVLSTPGQSRDWAIKVPFIAVAFMSIAYVFGIFSESVGVLAFEWWHRKVKRKRWTQFQTTIRARPALFQDDPVGIRFAKIGDALTWYTGFLRFYILSRDAGLYARIESQLSRLRVTRALLMAESIVALATFIRFVRAQDPALRGALLWICLALLAVMAANAGVLHYRFHRYCSAIEKSYLVLAMKR